MSGRESTALVAVVAIISRPAPVYRTERLMTPEPVATSAIPRLPNTDRLRLSRRHVIGLVILAACGCSPIAATDAPGGSTQLLVWAWDVDKDSDDFLAVVDVDRRSPTHGQVVRTLPARGGRGAHHVEYEMTTSQLFANSFETGRTFVFDLGDPGHPRQLSEFGDVGAYSHPHSYARTPSGTVLGTFQGLASDHRAVGGLVEMDDHGKLIRATSAANRLDPDLRPYSLTIVPQLDRVVTTSADMHGMLVGRSVQDSAGRHHRGGRGVGCNETGKAGDRGRTSFRGRCPPPLARDRTRRKAPRDDRRRHARRRGLPDRHESGDGKAHARGRSSTRRVSHSRDPVRPGRVASWQDRSGVRAWRRVQSREMSSTLAGGKE